MSSRSSAVPAPRARQRVVEAVVLAQDAGHRRLVAHQQGLGRVVHLPGERVLDLLRTSHPLVRLVEHAALLGGARDRVEADGGHRDEERGDEEEREEQLGVDGGAHAGHPGDERADGRAGEEKGDDAVGFCPAPSASIDWRSRTSVPCKQPSGGLAAAG